MCKSPPQVPGCHQQTYFPSIPSAFCSPGAGGSACASEGAECPSPSWLLSLPWPQLSAGTRPAHGGASHCSPQSARCGTGCSTSLVLWLLPWKTRVGQWAVRRDPEQQDKNAFLHSGHSSNHGSKQSTAPAPGPDRQIHTHTLLSLGN